MVHIPILRAGRPYSSLSTTIVKDFRTDQPIAEVSQAPAGLIARDMGRAPENRSALESIPVRRLMDMCRKAADLFMQASLPVGDQSHSPEDYVNHLSATTGMPHTLCRNNMDKIAGVLSGIDRVLKGLTRCLDPEILDNGFGFEDGSAVSYRAATDSLGAVLPSNSPGVHSLWIPSLALKIPVVLKPGRDEPWSPYRIAQAMIAAGFPEQSFGFYPSDDAGAAEIVRMAGRSIVFGDKDTVAPWRHDERVQVHGPGWSKWIVGADSAHRWPEFLEPMATSICLNGGRSCINASAVWTAGEGRELAEALARRLSEIQARPMDDPKAELTAFPDARVAHRLSEMIDQQIDGVTAIDCSRPYRSERVVECGGATFLLPTVIWCQEPTHPLAQAEYLFPFASVVEIPQGKMLSQIGSTLVATAVTEDVEFVRELLGSSRLERLNIGPIPTCSISWDQPHEGNLFEHLFRQRALQSVRPFEEMAASLAQPVA